MWLRGMCSFCFQENCTHCIQVFAFGTHYCDVHAVVAQAAAGLSETPTVIEYNFSPSAWPFFTIQYKNGKHFAVPNSRSDCVQAVCV